MNKKGDLTEVLGWVIIGVLVLAIGMGFIFLIKGKWYMISEIIKGWFRF